MGLTRLFHYLQREAGMPPRASNTMLGRPTPTTTTDIDNLITITIEIGNKAFGMISLALTTPSLRTLVVDTHILAMANLIT